MYSRVRISNRTRDYAPNGFGYNYDSENERNAVGVIRRAASLRSNMLSGRRRQMTSQDYMRTYARIARAEANMLGRINKAAQGNSKG